MRPPIRSSPRRWLATVIALFAVVCAACGGSDAPSPTPAVASSTAGSSPSPAAAPPATPSGPRVIETVTPSAEIVATLVDVEEFVVRVRGRGLEREVARSFVTSAGMRALLDEELADPETIEAVREEALLLRALGLIGPNVDLLETYRGLLGSQVIGLYSPDDSALYVLANAPPGPLELTTYAHEFQHAAQDQHFDLTRIDEGTRGNRDGSLAAAALIEGDATYTQTLYVQQVVGVAGALALLGSAGASAPPANTPPALLDLLRFPYLQGMNFVTAVVRRGGVGAVDGVFARLPVSSEQIIHPEKYFAGETPSPSARQFPTAPGWSIEDEDVIGEYLFQIWLRDLGLSAPVASAAAAGWGGDRYAVVRGPGEARALLAHVQWDSKADADEFEYALFPAGPAPGVQVRSLSGGRVLAVTRVDASTLALAIGFDRATAEEAGRLLASP